jgi:PAS domain S-box-containing protein
MIMICVGDIRMKLIKILLIFLSSITLTTFLFSQAEYIQFKHLTTDDGLSQGWIRRIVQDQFGFIWFGTDNGLNCYDGYNIKVFQHEQNNKYSVLDNGIAALYVDRQGTLWIGTYNGLCIYERENARFITSPNWPKGIITSISQDSAGTLWISASYVILRYDQKTDSFKLLSKKYHFEGTVYGSRVIDDRAVKKTSALTENFINCFLFDKKQNLWVGTINGLYIFDSKKYSYFRYINDEHSPKSLLGNYIYNIQNDPRGRIWLGTSKGLCVFDYTKNPNNEITFNQFKNNDEEQNSITNGAVLSLLIDKSNLLWIGSEKGGLDMLDLNLFDKNVIKFKHNKHSPFKSTSISDNSIYVLYEDHQENIWAGTFGNGVDLFSRNAVKFKLVVHEQDNMYTINNNQVNTFLEEKDFIWIGTEGGLNRFDKKTGKYKFFVNDPANKTSLGSNAVWSIYKDKRGSLWIGTWEGGLNRYDYYTETFSHYYNNPDDTTSIGSNNIFSIFEDSRNNLWIGTMGGGLNLFDRDKNTFSRYINARNIFCDYVEAIIETKKGELWLANVNSLELFDRKTKRAKHYMHDDNDSTSIAGSSIFAIFEDSKENLWVGTDAGLNLYLRVLDGFKYYKVKNGLPDNAIKSITEDNQGNLWLGTTKGLSKFINAIDLPVVPTFRNYTVEEGLQGKEFNRRSCMKATNGLIYFGGVKGFNILLPDSMVDNPNAPNVVITDFLLFNKPVTIGGNNSPLRCDISATKEMNLNYDQSVISFIYTGLNMILPEKNQYAYKMEGFDKQWNYVGNKREAVYTNLNPGHYVFRVIACNNDGKWNKKGTSIKITILPPWWRTWWFKLTIVLLIVFCLFYFMSRTINKIINTANLSILDERNQLKTLINSIPDYVFIKDKKSRFLIVNESTIKYMGGNNESEFLNKTDLEIYPKEIAEPFLIEEQKIISSGIPLVNAESRRYFKGIESYFSTTKCPIFNSKGEIIGLVGFVRDITEKKKAELDVIRKSEELKKYNEILSETNIILEERQQHIEEQAEELRSTNEKLMEKQRKIEEQSEELKAHSENLKNINELLIEKQHLVLKQSEQLKDANRQLFILNTTKDRFFSIIAHDLRNPFNVISGFARLLLDKFDKLTTEKVRKYHELIFTSSTGANNLLENLLQWSRSQTGLIAFEPVKLNLLAIVEEVFGLMEGNAMHKHILLEHFIESNITLVADENMIKAIIRNLVSNAIKFTDANGTISVSYSLNNQHIEISVKDTGIGIDDDIIKKLFRIDTIISTKGTAKETGTGLGLILCKEFVEKHKGKIWVESKVGKGSTFVFSIPYS